MEYISDIGSIIAIIISVIAVYLNVKKQPHETNNLDAATVNIVADAIEKYQKIALTSANRLSELETEFYEFRQKTEKEIRELRQERDDLKDWAQRLVYQIVSLKQQPVPFKRSEAE